MVRRWYLSLDTRSIRGFKQQIEEMTRSTQISILKQLTDENARCASAIFNCSGVSIDCASYDTPTFVFWGEGCTVSVSITKKQNLGNGSPVTPSSTNTHPPDCPIAAALACQELLRLIGGHEKELPFCI